MAGLPSENNFPMVQQKWLNDKGSNVILKFKNVLSIQTNKKLWKNSSFRIVDHPLLNLHSCFFYK